MRRNGRAACGESPSVDVTTTTDWTHRPRDPTGHVHPTLRQRRRRSRRRRWRNDGQTTPQPQEGDSRRTSLSSPSASSTSTKQPSSGSGTGRRWDWRENQPVHTASGTGDRHPRPDPGEDLVKQRRMATSPGHAATDQEPRHGGTQPADDGARALDRPGRLASCHREARP